MDKLRIKEIRKMKGVSQIELATRMRCSRSWVSKIENKNVEDVSIGTLKDIFEALQMHPSEVCYFCNHCEYKRITENIKKYNLPK